MAATRREASLSGWADEPQWTTLRELRRFVRSLERWPDNAQVEADSGLVIRVAFMEDADPMIENGDEQ